MLKKHAILILFDNLKKLFCYKDSENITLYLKLLEQLFEL